MLSLETLSSGGSPVLLSPDMLSSYCVTSLPVSLLYV